jgi:hypothetical protein
VFPYVFVWGNNPVRAALRGRRCRVLVRSRRFNSCLVEFEDGRRAVVSRHALRRATDFAGTGGSGPGGSA